MKILLGSNCFPANSSRKERIPLLSLEFDRDSEGLGIIKNDFSIPGERKESCSFLGNLSGTLKDNDFVRILTRI